MHESRKENGQDRLLNAGLSTRVLLTLVVTLSIVLAGCTGTTGLSDVGDGGAGDADDSGPETDSSDGDSDVDVDSMLDGNSDAEDDWFNLSEPGYYEFDLAGMDKKTGEQVTGRLIYEIEAADGNEITTSVDYEFGDEQYQSVTTGPGDEVAGQLFLTPAHAPVLTLQSVSLLYYFEMGFTDPSVGNRKQSTTDEGTQVTEVTEKRTYTGIECFFVETTIDGELSQQSCIRGSEGGIAPYAATYTDGGELELEIELVEHE